MRLLSATALNILDKPFRHEQPPRIQTTASMSIETILSPAELTGLASRDLSRTACVVFDILRATSTFVTALHHGAHAIIPVSEIAEAVALKKTESGKQKAETILLAGERDGVRIRAAQSGGIDFDFGNSPREFTAELVRGKTIVSTTTNGTRALRACAKAKTVLAASFLNLAATAEHLRGEQKILLVCAGTGEGVADEDVLAAGALIELLTVRGDSRFTISPPSHAAWEKYSAAQADLLAAMGRAKNGKRLLAIPELQADVAFCAQADIFPLVAKMEADGSLRRQS
jgi:2-phosphosulfolactate phosphatase